MKAIGTHTESAAGGARDKAQPRPAGGRIPDNVRADADQGRSTQAATARGIEGGRIADGSARYRGHAVARRAAEAGPGEKQSGPIGHRRDGW